MLLPTEQFSIFLPKSWLIVNRGNFINGKIKQKWPNNILARTCSSAWFVFLLNGEHSDCCTRTRWQTYNEEQIYSSVCCLCLILQSIPVVISLAPSVYDLTAQSGLLVVSPHVLGRAGWGVGKQGAGEALVVGGRVVAWQTVVFEFLGPKHSRTVTNIKCYWLTYSMRDTRLFMAIYTVLHNSCPWVLKIKQIIMHGPIFFLNVANERYGQYNFFVRRKCAKIALKWRNIQISGAIKKLKTRTWLI